MKIHDAGKGSDASSSRIGSLGRALIETMVKFDFQKQTFNTPELLGDMGRAPHSLTWRGRSAARTTWEKPYSWLAPRTRSIP
ncbi:hypothetical protein PSAC2689_50066 [Paraburkholderia sacchari]